MTVRIAVTVDPKVAEKAGTATVVVPGDSEAIPLVTEQGISALVAAERGPITAGSTVTLTVTPELRTGVTDSGLVTLTATDGVTFGESEIL